MILSIIFSSEISFGLTSTNTPNAIIGRAAFILFLSVLKFQFERVLNARSTFFLVNFLKFFLFFNSSIDRSTSIFIYDFSDIF